MLLIFLLSFVAVWFVLQHEEQLWLIHLWAQISFAVAAASVISVLALVIAR
jgi:hypothetical protein